MIINALPECSCLPKFAAVQVVRLPDSIGSCWTALQTLHLLTAYSEPPELTLPPSISALTVSQTSMASCLSLRTTHCRCLNALVLAGVHKWFGACCAGPHCHGSFQAGVAICGVSAQPRLLHDRLIRADSG